MIAHRKNRWCVVAPLLLFLASFSASALAATPYTLILCGSGGEEAYTKKFTDWGLRLRKVLTTKFGYDAPSIALLTEQPQGEGSPGPTTTLESIRAAFTEAAPKISPERDLLIILIGHGSYLRQISKFEIPGPDLSAEELNSLINSVHARRTAVVDSASCSAGFINVLSGPNRIICSATKSTNERNATSFMEYFIQALEEGSADLNRDDRISVLEACRQGATLTASWYEGEGLIATEHALLDDNGDGLGTRLADFGDPDTAPAPGVKTNPDGAFAETFFVKDFSFPSSVPKELVDRYLAALDKIAALKREKATMEPPKYHADLEALLVEAAKANRAIREKGGLELPGGQASASTPTPTPSAPPPASPAAAPANGR